MAAPKTPGRIQTLRTRAKATQTPTQKLAEQMTAFFGSTAFLIGNAVWFFVWIVLNVRMIPSLNPFDPFPFSMLTMVVSLEAIFLSIFVLMAANHAEQVDQLRAEIDLQVNTIAETELTKLIEIVVRIAEKQGIDLSGDVQLQQMIAPTNVEEIAELIEAEVAPDVRRKS
ncbi:MAG: DUF1003 domain-containing protein [Kofleriaceae bacterium]